MSDEYKYYCDKCSYGTNVNHSFTRHNESVLHQTGKKKKKSEKIKETHDCSKCDYSSTNKNNYLTHKLNNHSTKEERKAGFNHYCEMCDVGVFTKTSFHNHLGSKRHIVKCENYKKI